MGIAATAAGDYASRHSLSGGSSSAPPPVTAGGGAFFQTNCDGVVDSFSVVGADRAVTVNRRRARWNA